MINRTVSQVQEYVMCAGGDRLTTIADLTAWMNNALAADHGLVPDRFDLASDLPDPDNHQPVVGYFRGVVAATINRSRLGFLSLTYAPPLNLHPCAPPLTVEIEVQRSSGSRYQNGCDLWRHGGECDLPPLFHAQALWWHEGTWECSRVGGRCWHANTPDHDYAVCAAAPSPMIERTE